MPPCPVMKMKTFERSSVRSRFERGTDGSTRPARTPDIAPTAQHTDAYKETARTGEDAEEVLDGYLVPAVVHLDVVSVEVECAPRAVVDTTWKLVARVARDVVREHEDDIGVGDAQPFHGAVPALDMSAL